MIHRKQITCHFTHLLWHGIALKRGIYRFLPAPPPAGDEPFLAALPPPPPMTLPAPPPLAMPPPLVDTVEPVP